MQIPEAMAAYPQFIVWAARPGSKPGKIDKVPINPATGRNIDPHDPSNWLTAAAATQLAQSGQASGVGFVFTPADPFFFFDLDDALQADGQWSPLAQYMCQVFAGCFIEVSYSGRGLHIFGAGNPPAHACKNTPLKLELYTHSRFVALTCNGHGNPGQPMQPQLEWLATNYFPPSATAEVTEWTDGPCDEWRGPEDDDALIEKMLSSRGSAGSAFSNRATVVDLWNAEADVLANCYPPQRDGADFDHSSADAALCQHLAFWTGKDCERMDRLFRLSGLYREKWERADYRQNTILHATGHCSQVYGSRQAAEQHPAPPESAVSSGPVLATDPGGLRSGTQFLSVIRQQEHFAGCVYIRDAHRIWTPDGSLLKSEQFKATYGGFDFALDMNNEKTTKSAWEAFTESRGYHFPKVHAACFRPELPSGQLIEEEGQALVNTYVPIITRSLPGDPTPFLRQIALMLPDPTDQYILLSYMAGVVQYPGKKFMWAPLIQGVKGNGKSLLGKVLTYCVGSRYTEKPDPNDISNKFNAWLLGKLLIIIDELYMGDRRDMENSLKRLITEDRMGIQGKGDNQATGDNRANFMLNTNYKAAIRVDDDERRYAVFYTAQQERAHLDRDGMGGGYFPWLVSWLEADGYAIVNHYLRNFPIPDEYNPALLSRAPRTSSTQDAITASLGTIEQELLEAIGEGRPGFAGGFVSSLAFDKLLEDKHMAGKLPRQGRRDVLRALGYDWHPGLPEGRTHNAIPCPAVPGRPRIYVRGGHPNVHLTGAEVVRCYLEAQSSTTQAAMALGVGA